MRIFLSKHTHGKFRSIFLNAFLTLNGVGNTLTLITPLLHLFFFFLKDKKNVKRTNCLVVPELKRR